MAAHQSDNWTAYLPEVFFTSRKELQERKEEEEALDYGIVNFTCSVFQLCDASLQLLDSVDVSVPLLCNQSHLQGRRD